MAVPEAAAQPAPLMPSFLDELTPEAPLKFSKTFPFPFDNQETRITATRKIAAEVSSFLRIWLTPGPGSADLHTDIVRASLADKHTFVCGPDEFSEAGITVEQSAAFQSRVSTRVRGFLSGDLHLDRMPDLNFRTDYSPYGDLLECLTACGIHCPPGSLIFPKGSLISINPYHLDLKPIHEIRVSINFTNHPYLTSGELKATVLDPNQKLDFTRTLVFENSRRNLALEEASGQVADFLSVFLTEEGRTQKAEALLKSKQTSINYKLYEDEDSDYSITPEKINDFKVTIRRKIKTNLCRDWHPFSELSTEFLPTKDLKDALIEAQFGPKFDGLFPDKSSVFISLKEITDKMGEIKIEVSFAH